MENKKALTGYILGLLAITAHGYVEYPVNAVIMIVSAVIVCVIDCKG